MYEFLFLIILLASTPASAADSTSTNPKDASLCNVSLKSLSKATGAPGDTFEMMGVWEDTQGTKTAAINMGAGHTLEVIEWTPALLRVRIPEGLSPGVYKVGVYCNNPPHWQGSGFMDFTVSAKANQRADAQSAPSQSTVSPSTDQSRSGQPADAQATRVADQKNIAKKQSAVKTPPESAEESLVGYGNLAILIIILIFAAISAWAIFRYFRKSPVKNEPGDFTGGAQTVKSTSPDSRIKTKDDLAPFGGVYNKVKYTVENLGEAPGKNGGSAVPIMTISIDIDKALPGQFELNARDNVKRIPPGEKGRICMELVTLGADYIDVGYNTSRVAAEVPTSRAKADRALAEKVVERLIKLRDLSQ